MEVQDEIEEGIERAASLYIYIYIYVYVHFSIHRTFRKQTPGFRVAFGAVVAATEISGI